MDTPVTRAEFEQFQELMKSENEKLAAEDSRQNKRLDKLESNVGELWHLAGAIKELAVNMQNMAKEQERQGEQLKSITTIAAEISRVNTLSENQKEIKKRLSDLENHDGDSWRKFKWLIVTLVAGIVIGFLAKSIGLPT